MKQSRKASFIESWVNIAIGLSIQYLGAWFFMNFALGIPFSHTQNTLLAIFMTVISLIRSYTLRRVFEHLRVKGILQ